MKWLWYEALGNSTHVWHFCGCNCVHMLMCRGYVWRYRCTFMYVCIYVKARGQPQVSSLR